MCLTRWIGWKSVLSWSEHGTNYSHSYEIQINSEQSGLLSSFLITEQIKRFSRLLWKPDIHQLVPHLNNRNIKRWVISESETAESHTFSVCQKDLSSITQTCGATYTRFPSKAAILQWVSIYQIKSSQIHLCNSSENQVHCNTYTPHIKRQTHTSLTK